MVSTGGDFLGADGALVVAEFALSAFGLELLLASRTVSWVESLKKEFCEFCLSAAAGTEHFFLSRRLSFIEGPASIPALSVRGDKVTLRIPQLICNDSKGSA